MVLISFHRVLGHNRNLCSWKNFNYHRSLHNFFFMLLLIRLTVKFTRKTAGSHRKQGNGGANQEQTKVLEKVRLRQPQRKLRPRQQKRFRLRHPKRAAKYDGLKPAANKEAPRLNMNIW